MVFQEKIQAQNGHSSPGFFMSTQEALHIPVLLYEVLEMLDVHKGKRYIDLTLGAGGHFQKINEVVGSDGQVWGVDRDHWCIAAMQERFPKGHFVHGDWISALNEIKDALDLFDGVLIDCGVSSMQLDRAQRGFSFRFDGPLDMRMDQNSGMSAKDVLAQLNEQEIANIIYQYGEERRSRRIAKSIVLARKNKKLETTFDLVRAVEHAIGPKKGKRHPATQTFQAIRMYVNQELELLKQTLEYLTDTLKSESKIVVLTFHSLEDRLVKHLFRDLEKEKKLKRLNKKAIRPTREEIRKNPRSRSAILRGASINRV